MKSNIAEKIDEYFKLIMLAAAYLACIFSPPSVYALQPPPPPLDIEQLEILVSRAEVIVVANVKQVKETEGSIEATLCVEKLLKGEISGKTMEIRETYKTADFPSATLKPENRNDGASIVRSVAGPSTYRGKYEKGLRIIALLEKDEKANKYKPLGSGTYNKHLCEFIIENGGVKPLYFRFAQDISIYTGSEKYFICLIKKLIRHVPE